jgi:hypothetical protein
MAYKRFTQENQSSGNNPTPSLFPQVESEQKLPTKTQDLILEVPLAVLKHILRLGFTYHKKSF